MDVYCILDILYVCHACYHSCETHKNLIQIIFIKCLNSILPNFSVFIFGSNWGWKSRHTIYSNESSSSSEKGKNKPIKFVTLIPEFVVDVSLFLDFFARFALLSLPFSIQLENGFPFSYKHRFFLFGSRKLPMDLLNSWFFLYFSLFYFPICLISIFLFHELAIGKYIIYTHLNDNAKILVWNQIIQYNKKCFDEIPSSLAKNRILKRERKWDQRQKEMRRKELNLFRSSSSSLLLLLNHRYHAALETKTECRLKITCDWRQSSTYSQFSGACNTHAMMLALLKQFLIRQNKKFGSMVREKEKSTHFAVRVYAKTLMIISWYFWWLQNINSETISVKLNEHSIHRVREREREKLEIVIRLVKMVDIIRNRSYTHPEQAASNHRMHIWF